MQGLGAVGGQKRVSTRPGTGQDTAAGHSPVPASLKKEHPKLYAVFDQLDADNSGRISHQEIIQHFVEDAASTGCGDVCQEEVQQQAVHLLSVVDKDKSKSVDFQEFTAAFGGVRNPTKSSISHEWTNRAGLDWYFGSENGKAFSADQLVLAGGMGALASRMATAPAERVRLIMQTGGRAAGSPLQIVRRILAQEGVRGLWRSNLASCLQVFPQGATICLVYGSLSQAGVDTLGRDLNPWERLWCGAVAGACAGVVTHPLELIRTRLAVQPAAPLRAPSTMRPASTRPPVEGGSTMPLARVIGGGAGAVGVPSSLHRVAPPEAPSLARNLHNAPPGARSLPGAGTGGMLAAAVRRVSSAATLSWTRGGVYAGVRDAASRIWARDGLSGFYRGLGPSVLASTVFVSVMQTAFDGVVRQGRCPTGLAGLHWQCQDHSLTLAAGLVAGGLAQMAVHPIDTIKRRMMTLRARSARAQSGWQLAKGLAAAEGGWGALYRGTSPALAKVVPAVAISLFVREVVLGRARGAAHDTVNATAAVREMPQWLRPSWALPRAHPDKK